MKMILPGFEVVIFIAVIVRLIEKSIPIHLFICGFLKLAMLIRFIVIPAEVLECAKNVRRVKKN